MISSMIMALAHFADPRAILLLMLGVSIGVLFGALPGLGPTVALAVVLPFTYNTDPILAMFLYSAVMSSCAFGGAVPAVLLNTPGTPANAATCFDGYPMAQRGEGARAVSISATSCLAGSVGGVVITIALLPVVKPIVFAFGPPEFFSLVLCGLIMIAFAAKGNLLKGVAGGCIGFLLSLIGFSEMVGVYRFTMGSEYLWDGIPLVPFIVGLFAVSELINYSSRGGKTYQGGRVDTHLHWRGQTATGIRDVLSRPGVVTRSTIIGTVIGIMPGLGGSVAAFMSYAVGLRRTRNPATFGKGNPEGVICSEVANHAKEGGALLPTVAFGIPGSPDMAILLGAFVLHGLQPGPELLRSHLDLVYALLFGIGFSQFVTSGAGLIITPFLARVSLLQSRWLAPFVLTLVFVGTYMLRSNIFDVAAAVLAGMFGFVMRRYGFPLVTIAIGFILGPLAERSFQQSMQMSDGSAAIFFIRPISAVLLALGLAALIFPAVPALRRALRTRHES